MRYSRDWRIHYSASRPPRDAISALASVVGGHADELTLRVRRGRVLATTYQLEILELGRPWAKAVVSATRRWPGADVKQLKEGAAAFTREIVEAADRISDEWAENDGEPPPVYPSLAKPGRVPPLGKFAARPAGAPTGEEVQGKPREFGFAPSDLLLWRRPGLLRFGGRGAGSPMPDAIEYEQQRRRAFWDQTAFISVLGLLGFMAASWSLPLNWWSVGFGWGGVLGVTAVFAAAQLTGRLRTVAAVASAAVLSIAIFGLVYATLLVQHELLPKAAWGQRLGRAFLLSVGVGATAGTFDEPLRDALRVVAHVQLLLFVGGTAGTAGWAAWRAIRGIAEVDEELSAAREDLAEVEGDIDRVADRVQEVRQAVDANAAAVRSSFASATSDVFGSVEGLYRRLGDLEELLRGLASHVGYQPPPREADR